MKQSKSQQAAIKWVQDLMDHLWLMDRMNKRTAIKAMELLRAGCMASLYVGDEIPLWEENINAFADLDTAEALLSLSNRLAWNADQQRWVLEDVYRNFNALVAKPEEGT
jgi:hypothetical protein